MYNKNSKIHIVAVVGMIRNSEGKFLVLKRRDDEVAYPGMWTLPGGKVEGNATVDETLVNEIREEAGLIMKPGKIPLKDVAFVRPDNQTVKVFSYLCEVESDHQAVISKNFTDYKWIALQELSTLEHVGIEKELRRAENILRSNIPLQQLHVTSKKVE